MTSSQPRCPYQGETSAPVNSKNPDFLSSCSRRNLGESGDGRVGTLVVLDADWSVITKYGRFFDLMNINELSRSVPATFSRPLSCREGTYQLLTCDTNPSVVTSTFVSADKSMQLYQWTLLLPCIFWRLQPFSVDTKNAFPGSN